MKLKSFENQCLDYIQSAFEKEIELPIHSKIEFNDNGSIIYNLHINDINSGRIIKPHKYIDYLTVFMLFDALLEKQIPKLNEKLSYRSKLDYLPELTNIDKIQKDFYRFIIIIRNSIIHHLDEINDLGDSIAIEYKFQGKKNSIKINFDSLNNIISYVTFRVKNEILNGYYFELYVLEYYYRTILGIEYCQYNDDNILPKKKLSESFQLNRNYVFIKNEIEVETIRKKLEQANLLNSSDYVYEKNNIQYIIPSIKFQKIDDMQKLTKNYFA